MTQPRRCTGHPSLRAPAWGCWGGGCVLRVGSPKSRRDPIRDQGGWWALLLTMCYARRSCSPRSSSPVWGPSAPAASHAGSLVNSERGNPLTARNDCRLRGPEPKPSHRAGAAAFSLPFELPQPPGAAVPPSTDRGSWGGGMQGAAASIIPHPPLRCPLPRRSPSTPQHPASGHRSGASASCTTMGHRSFGFAGLPVTPPLGEGVGRGCCQGPASTGPAGE